MLVSTFNIVLFQSTMKSKTEIVESTSFTCETSFGFGRLYQEDCYTLLDRKNEDLALVDSCSESCAKLGLSIPNYEQFSKLNYTRIYESFPMVYYDRILNTRISLKLELEVSLQYSFHSHSWEIGNNSLEWHTAKYPKLNDILSVSFVDQTGVRFSVQNVVKLNRNDYYTGNSYPTKQLLEPKAYYFCNYEEISFESVKNGTLQQAQEECEIIMTPSICSDQILQNTLRTSCLANLKTIYYKCKVNNFSEDR